jgi:hypothetical protein
LSPGDWQCPLMPEIQLELQGYCVYSSYTLFVLLAVLVATYFAP